MSRRLTSPEYEALKQTYFSGWKTWNVNSVFSYVHMPDALSLRISVKEYQSGHYLADSLIGQFPDTTGLNPKEVLYPGDHALDDSYTAMKASWCGLEFTVETAQEDGDLYVMVMPEKGQVKPALLVLEAGHLWNRAGSVVRRDSCLVSLSGGKPADGQKQSGDAVQQSAYKISCTKSVCEEDVNVPCMGPFLAVLLDGPVAFRAEKTALEDALSAAHGAPQDKPAGERDLQWIADLIVRKKAALEKKREPYGSIGWMMQAMECAIAWDTVFDPNHNRVVSPVSRLWSIRSGGYVLFCWDNYFAGLMAAVCGCRELAYSNLIEITNERTGKGFVPNFAWGTGQKSEDRSQPPVGASMLLGVWRIFREDWIVKLLFPALVEWNTWFWDHRRAESGALCWGSDPIPVQYGNIWEIDGVNERYGAALESGLDNSPMYDDIPFNRKTHMLELEDAGLTGLFIRDCDALLALSEIIEDLTYVEELKARKAKAQEGLAGMWDDQTGFFCNRRTDTGEFSHRLSPTNFYALYSDQVSTDQVERVIRDHYYNETEFYGEWMLPSIARCDPAFKDQDYWRGRVWAPLNFLTYLALKKQGCSEVCADLAEKSVRIFRKEWDEHRHVHENYNSITGEGCDAKNSDKFYHWGALMSVIALMEAEPAGDLDLSV